MVQFSRLQIFVASMIVMVFVTVSCHKSPNKPQEIIESPIKKIVLSVFPNIGTTSTQFQPSVLVIIDCDTAQIGQNYLIGCDYDNDGVTETDWLDTIPRTANFETYGKHTLNFKIKDSTGYIDSVSYNIYIAGLIQITPTSPSGDYENNIDWSKDGTNRIAYDSYGGELGANQSIFVMNYPGGTPQKVSSNPNPGEYFFDQFPEWSPNGDKIACYSSNGLDLINVENGTRISLVEGSSSIMKSWSPDGRWLIYWGQHEGTAGTMLYDFDNDSIEVLFEREAYTAWSPDGTQIAASHRVVFPDQSLFQIIDFATRDTLESVEIPSPGDKLDWSPDGKWISLGFDNKDFLSMFQVESGNIFTYSPDHLIACWWPSWSEDGTLLAFEAQEADGGFRLSIWAMEFPADL